MEQHMTMGYQSNRLDHTNQYLTFTLGREEYGIEILKVHEIKAYGTVTPLPNTPAHIKGVMNLRGMIMPVVDLRVKFGLTADTQEQFAVVIVVNVRDKVMGLVVNAVSDVLTIGREEIQAAPNFGAQVDLRFIAGMTKAGEKVVILLDLERLLSDEELAVVEPSRTEVAEQAA